MRLLLQYTIVLISLIFICGCEKSPSPMPKIEPSKKNRRDQAVEVETSMFKKLDVYSLETLAGYIEPTVKAPVYSSVTGYISKQVAKEGQFVRKGGALMSLKPDGHGHEFQPSLVTANISGTVLQWNKKLFERVQNGEQIGLMARLDRFQTTAYVGQSDLDALNEGDLLEASFSIDHKKPRSLQAVIQRIIPSKDPKTLSYPVVMAIKCKQKDKKCSSRLRSGSPVFIFMKKNRRQSFLVDSRYLHSMSTQIITMTKDNRCVYKDIEVGEVFGLQTEVVSGIDEKSVVVTHSSKRLRDGDLLKVTTKLEAKSGPVTSESPKVEKQVKASQTPSRG